jgi:hypothetical protein
MHHGDQSCDDVNCYDSVGSTFNGRAWSIPKRNGEVIYMKVPQRFKKLYPKNVTLLLTGIGPYPMRTAGTKSEK